MAINITLSLAILAAGFAAIGAGEAYGLSSSGALLPGTSVVFLASTALTVMGLMLVVLGRRTWRERDRFRLAHSNRILAFSVLGGFVAAAEVTLLLLTPSIGTPA